MSAECVFCDRTKFEEHLIRELKDFWVIATLGQITDGGYTLLVPKRHVSCLGAMNESETEPFLRAMKKVDISLSEFNRAGTYQRTIFEHGIVGQTVKHAHLHFLPVAIDMTSRIKQDFPNAEFEKVQNVLHLQELYGKRQEPYLFWSIPGDRFMACWNPPAPPQYLRIVVAEALGRPERANWRTMDPELDKRLWSETVTRLKPYFL